MNDMIKTGILERHGSYLAGEFPKAIRFTQRFRSGPFEIVELETQPAIKAASASRSIDPANLEAAGLHFWHNSTRFQLTHSRQSVNNHWDAYTIARWNSQDHHAIRCRYRRYHSLPTQTSRRIRKHLTSIDGGQLAIVDVSACQPMLAGMAAAGITDHHRHTQPTEQSGTNEVLRIFSKGGERLRQRFLPRDLSCWIDLCEAGQIYGYMQDRVRQFDEPAWRWIERDDGSRIRIDMRDASLRQIKRATLIPMFEEQAHAEKSPVFQVIAEDFPTIANFVRSVKNGKHEALACLLQSLEAGLMIDRIGNVIRTHVPDEPVQPIHDAMVVRAEFADSMKVIIEDEFKKLGLCPKVKLELLCSPVANPPDGKLSAE